jgi:ArsR family transcriptional regulator
MTHAPTPPFRLPTRATADDVLAKHFRGFGDATRLRIIDLLSEGERSVGELVLALDEPQPKVSNHLAALRWCGYVATERRGKRVIYRLADDRVGEVVALVRRLAKHETSNGASAH